MSERQETTDDIIAGKRFDATTRDQFDSAYIVDFCDRLEAARKRESGNCAKLREALLKAIVLLKVCDWPDDTPMQDVAEVIDEIEKASSAPPRNCDIYLTEEAVDAATVTVRDCEACPRIDMEAPCVFCMVRWLLAPAKEGGAK